MHSQSGDLPTTVASTSAAPILSNVACGVNQLESQTIMLTAQAFVLNGARKVPVRLFLDQGSGLTFLSPSLRLLLLNVRPVGRRNLTIAHTFSNEEEFSADRFRIVLQSVNDPKSKISLLAYERAFRVNPQNDLPKSAFNNAQKFAETHDLADHSLINASALDPPGIIVGLDQLFKVLLLEAPKRIEENLIALNSHLGWCVGGPPTTSSGDGHARVTAVQAVCCVATLSQLPLPPPSPTRSLSTAAQQTENLWRLDAIGINEQSAEETRTAEEISALRQFDASLKYAVNATRLPSQSENRSPRSRTTPSPLTAG